ncbi:MAG: AbgT family transporter [Planctomycetota bacterium]
MTETPPPPKQDQSTPRQHKRGPFEVFLATVEWLGNCLPHPVTLFFLFALGVVIISGITGSDFIWEGGLAVEDPRPEGAKGRAEDGMIRAHSLFSGGGLRYITTNLVTNFTDFVPLGTVLVALLGVGVAEKSGLLGSAIRAIVLSAPKNLVTVVVVFAGILSNTASEMGYVVLIPLAAVIFHAVGRHPFAGLAAAFAGVSGGYSANLLIGTVDPLLSGITEEAARFIDPTYKVLPTANWFFMIASTFLITIIGSLVTMFIVEPRLGTYDVNKADESVDRNPKLDRLSRLEVKGLLWSLVACTGVSLLFVWAAGPMANLFGAIPGWGIMRDPESGSLEPFLDSVVAMIFIFFVIPGFVYGRIVGTMKNDRDIIDAMAHAMSTMGLYIVLVFFAAQFVAFFKESNLGGILAVVGADTIQALSLDNPLVFIPFILMCCFVNLMLGSASAQWAVTAPIFVPMLMYVGYSPEVIQAAYRIGDSTTNIITPMMSYFGLILAFACRYDRKLGIGTLVSTMLPYSICFFLGWVALFYIWVFALGLPVGPDAPTYFDASAIPTAP